MQGQPCPQLAAAFTAQELAVFGVPADTDLIAAFDRLVGMGRVPSAGRFNVSSGLDGNHPTEQCLRQLQSLGL